VPRLPRDNQHESPYCLTYIVAPYLARRTTDTAPTETDQEQIRATGIETSRSSRDRGSDGLAVHGFPVTPHEGRIVAALADGLVERCA